MAKSWLDNLSEDDLKHAVEVRGIAVLLGRALSLTIMAGSLPPGDTNEDRAISAMDGAWEKLADKIIQFALEN